MSLYSSFTASSPCPPSLEKATANLNAWVEVDLAAQRQNVQVLKAEFGEGVALIAVVKANAYGAGIDGVARSLEHDGADRFAVVWLDEALQLRELGVKRPILVLGGTPPARAEEAVAAGLTLTCDSEALGVALSQAAGFRGRRAVVHLHHDSGLNRDGLTARELVPLAKTLRELPNLTVEGLSTHMANADEANDSFSATQLAEFHALSRELSWIPFRHTANSATGLRRRAAKYNGVRVGLALHGVLPDNTAQAGLEPVLSLRARVLRVHDVSPGEGVSYGLTWRARDAARVALIPVGYADGWHRSLGNRGAVLLNGRRCPIVGRVCMDQFVVDVTAAGAVVPGDVATMIGAQEGAALDAREVAAQAGTIAWDILASIQPRLARLFHRNGNVEAVTEPGGRVTHYLALDPPSTV